MHFKNLYSVFILILFEAFGHCAAHEGPDPRAAWMFDKAYLVDQTLKSQSGPNLNVIGSPIAEKVGQLHCMRLDGNETFFVAQDPWEKRK